MGRARLALIVLAIIAAAGIGFLGGARAGFEEGYATGWLHQEIAAGANAVTLYRVKPTKCVSSLPTPSVSFTKISWVAASAAAWS